MKVIRSFSLTLDDAKADLIAGLSVAALALPQNMAYALIAGLDPIYGIYASVVAMTVAFFVGVSSYLIVGPTNMIAMAVASSLMGIETGYLEAVLLFTFMVGIFQLMLALLRLGELINYISRSVISGLTSGVALLIISGQLGYLFDIDYPGGYNIIIELYHFFTRLEQTNYYTLFIGVLSIFMIFSIKWLKPRLPNYLLSMIFGVVIVYILGWHEHIPMVEHFPSGPPLFTPVRVDFDFVLEFWGAALSVALLGFIHVLSVVKSLELQTGEEVGFNRVFVNQGIINILCSLFSGFVVTGSFTKSFANLQAGAKSKLSQLTAAITMLVFILFFSPLGRYIPLAALSGLVIVVAIKMIDFNEVRDNFKNSFDGLIFIATFLTTILAPRLDYAIYFGVIVSFVLVLKNTSSINYSHFDYEQRENEFCCRDLKEIREDEYIVINLAGNINFNASESLKRELGESFRGNQKFVIRMRDVENIDMTSLKELEKFIDRVQSNDGAVLFCGMNEDIRRMFSRYGLEDKIGKQNLFKADDHIFSSTEEAIKKAKEITLPYDIEDDD